MKIARLVEVDYQEFLKALRTAKAAETAVPPDDKAAWAKAVAELAVKAEAFRLMARERFGAEELVILRGEAPWDGLFAWNPESHACVRFEVSEG